MTLLYIFLLGKIKSREIPKQVNTIVESATNQSISILCETPSKSLAIPDLNKGSIANALNMHQKEKLQ